MGRGGATSHTRSIFDSLVNGRLTPGVLSYVSTTTSRCKASTVTNFNELPYPVLVTTSEGLILSVNTEFLALVGGQPSDWYLRPMQDLLAASSRYWLNNVGLPEVKRLGALQTTRLKLNGEWGKPIEVQASCKTSLAEQSVHFYWLFLVTDMQAATVPSTSDIPGARLILSVTNALPSPMAYWDKDLICRFSNQRYLEWFGKTHEEMRCIHIRAMMGERLFALNRPYIEGALAGVPQEFDREMEKPDGTIGYTQVNYVPDIDGQGVVLGFNAMVTNVTRLREADAAIRLSASVFDSTSEGIVVTDVNRKIVSANPAAARITGYPVTEMLGQSPRMMYTDRNGEAFYDAMERSFLAQDHWSGEQWVCRKDRNVIRLWISLSKIRNETGKIVRHLSLFSDITERHGKEELVRRMALHDALTDLPNRVLLMDRLTQLLATRNRSPHPIAVMFLDLDGFKQVNDGLGHDAGDEVLKTVAHRLLALLRTADTVARLGGDEFVVLLDNPEHREAVAHIAERIVTSVNLPIQIGNKPAHVGCSIGIAWHLEQGTSAGALLKIADAAMYVAKAAGKNTFRFG